MEIIFILICIAVLVIVIPRLLDGPSAENSPSRYRQEIDRYVPLGSPAKKSARDMEDAKLSGACFVVDGDTIVIGNHSIRLSGIDAPEMDHPYGKKAKWYLVNLTKGEKVTAVFHGEQTHAREVATCYLADGRDLSAEMVKAGFAIDWPKFSGGKYRHLETPDARKKMWRADARQKGRWPPPS